MSWRVLLVGGRTLKGGCMDVMALFGGGGRSLVGGSSLDQLGVGRSGLVVSSGSSELVPYYGR